MKTATLLFAVAAAFVIAQDRRELRAAFLAGNAAQSVADAAGVRRGVVIDLGNEYARLLQRQAVFTGMPNPAAVIDAVATDNADIGFVAYAPERRGTVEFCVLALVRRDAKYAAELGAELGELGLLTSEGTLYPLLSRLRRERLVETSWVESEAGPPRRYYSITDAGRQALRAFHQQWATFTAGVNRLLEEKR